MLLLTCTCARHVCALRRKRARLFKSLADARQRRNRRVQRLRPCDRGRVARVRDLGAGVDPHGLCTDGAEVLRLVYFFNRVRAIFWAQAQRSALAARTFHGNTNLAVQMR